MAWQIPQSLTTSGVTVNLGTADDVFVAQGVTIASTASNAILGTGNEHEVLIYGTVASATSSVISLAQGNGQLVTVKLGGHIQHLGPNAGVTLGTSFASKIINEGLISSPNGNGINLSSDNVGTQSEIVNPGTIEAGNIGIFHLGDETLVTTNSGVISASFSYQGFGGMDLITNTGRIVGDIGLGGGNDVYNGAKGRLNGDVFGGAGNDVITGGIDNDSFEGGAGNDTLTGGRGRDSLFGGADADRFNFDSIKESVNGGNRDQIMHFERGPDHIDLRDIDAESGVGGNQNFTFIGKSKFHDEKGELRYIDKGSTVIVQGDVNGDGKADFEIFVNVGALAKGDFIL